MLHSLNRSSENVGVFHQSFCQGRHHRSPNYRSLRTAQWTTKATSVAIRPQRNTQSDSTTMNNYAERLSVSKAQLCDIRDDFVKQMEAGLQGSQKSTLLMLPTMVDILPNGHEHGSFYGIELGGTNVRVVHAQLSKGVVGTMDSYDVALVEIGSEHMNCCAAELFDFLVKSLMTTSDERGWGLQDQEHPVIGLCFSYPMKQTSLHAGKLLKWTKGFNVADAVGKDPVQLLAQAFHRQGVQARITAMINDTVGTLAQARYKHHTDCYISLVLATGTNACYVEQLSRMPLWAEWAPGLHSRSMPRTSDMVVNLETAGFLSESVPRITEDLDLDQASSNPGEQPFEKLTSGLYVGDIVRRILLRLAREGSLFDGQVPEALEEEADFVGRVLSFTAEHMARVDHDTSSGLDETAKVLHEAFGLETHKLNLVTRQKVKDVCGLVRLRAARLTAAILAAVLSHIKRDGVAGPPVSNIVALDGAYGTRYTALRESIVDGIKELLPAKAAEMFVLQPVEGGSVLGAAIIAAAVDNYMKAMRREDELDLIMSPRSTI